MSEQVLTDLDFDSFGLALTLSQGLHDTGFIRCTPIQALTLPVALQGRDIAGQAQTGTGKTAAFLVAVMNRLLTQPAKADRRSQDPRAIILAPTRELAIQIDKDAQAIGRHTGLNLALVYGGVDYDKQRRVLQGDVDIVIATPGRLIDYFKQGALALRSIEVVVMDEADRMFDLGFIKDIRFLLRRMPGAKERQNLLFSATLSHRVLELAYEHMNEPEKLVVETETVTTSRVRQVVYFPASEEKLPLLLGLLANKEADRTMIFVNTKAACERVARVLERAKYRVGVLSGDVPQKKRESLLGKFQKGELELLVATDVAARGLHIAGVSHVFNYDLPFDSEDYVHRIGRTARLGAEGDAISFACDEYAVSLPDIEAYIEQKIPTARIEPGMLAEIPRRPPRTELPEGAEAEPSIIADAYSERAERFDRKGGGRTRGPGQAGGRGRDGKPRSDRRTGERSGPPKGDRAERGPRPDRPDRPNRDANRDARPDTAVNPVAAPVNPVLQTEDAAGEGEFRKRRRRRGGRNRHRDAQGVENGQSEQVLETGATAADAQPAKLLQRIKAKLKSMFSRLPLPRRK
ncbi:ATP-dependent RNA helicase RhlB [Ahniella affigens]|uniref:ATP-dependent RNA helicase RhlB n=1 Tax=Ahniella affigens TaxID=2021234 RepID=A0A2P1PMG2_9GAMM|nr:ATP-dependent RNA helicase RhlB [Ahniella affigens]AVP96025.1 ATP-dependent RNA helicase RhlB [Ahniella affigens]